MRGTSIGPSLGILALAVLLAFPGRAETLAPVPGKAMLHSARAASEVVGATLYSQANEEIGDIQDLIIGADGRIRAVLVDLSALVGGTGERLVAVEWKALRFDPNDKDRIRVALTGAQVARLPAWQEDDLMQEARNLLR
jgi:hypothetical protein